MQTRRVFAAALAAVISVCAHAQFEGPSASGRASTVAQASNNLRVGAYVTLSGHVVEHLRDEYFTFRDATGSIRAEIPAGVFRGQKVTPSTNVRIMGEIDRSFTGRYVHVKSLEVLP